MKTNSLLLTVCLAATTGLMTTGCRSGARTPVNTAKYDVENHEPVVLLGSRVQRSVTCSGLHKRTTSDGRLEIVADMRNREARRLEVQLNCEFKDATGRVVDAGPFRSLVLSPLAQEAVVFTAMNDSAKNFTIRVREVQ